MSRKKRIKANPNTPKPSPQLAKTKKFGARAKGIVPVLAVLILAGVPFCLGKYIEFNSPSRDDGGAYVYSAKHILDGAKLGIDERPSARPGTLLANVIGVAIFGFSDTGPKTIQMILQLTALVMMFCAMRKLFGSLAAVVGVVVASVYLSAPLLARVGNVKEQYMIAFMVIAASCFIFHQLSGRWWWGLSAGAAAVNTYYFKPTGLSVVIAMLVYLAVKLILHHRDWKKFLVRTLSLPAGAALGLIPLLVFYTWQGQSTLIINSFPVAALVFAATLLAIGMVLYLLIRLILHYGVFGKLKQVRRQIWLAGLLCAILILVPFLIYFADFDAGGSYIKSIPFIKYPYKLVLRLETMLDRVIALTGMKSGYVAASRGARDIAKQMPVILRYYMVLSLPVTLALGAIIAVVIRSILRVGKKIKLLTNQDLFVLFLGTWWFLDMAFIWVSTRAYEQYYLPLNASAAMLSGYLLWLYSRKLSASANKFPSLALGVAALVCAAIMSHQIFFGLEKSPYHQGKYLPHQRRGYAQRLTQAKAHRAGARYPWESVGEYIRQRTTKDDTIYVWGWNPGIYVAAQRLSSVPKAFESDMHIKRPFKLAREFNKMVSIFKQAPPKFIVDTRKRHFPNDRPPLELWPKNSEGVFLPLNKMIISQYNAMYCKMLADSFGKDEAERYLAMEPLREFIRKNYTIVKKNFDPYVFFELKADPAAPPAD